MSQLISTLVVVSVITGTVIIASPVLRPFFAKFAIGSSAGIAVVSLSALSFAALV